MQKSLVIKYNLFAALSLLIATIVFIPSQFPAQSQGSFTPTPTIPPSPVTIESDSEYVYQEGQWTSQTTTSVSGGSYLYNSGSTDDVLTLKFEGASVTIIYVEGPSLGTFAIEIDNTVVRTVITTNSTTNFNMQAIVDYLASGQHTLKVYPTEGTIAIDAFYGIPSFPQLVLPSPSPTGEGGASGVADGPEGSVWDDWVDGDFVFDDVYTPSSGCPAPDDLTTRNILLSGGLYAEVNSVNELEQAIVEANANQTTSPFLICITTSAYITLNNPLIINKSVNIYGQNGRAYLWAASIFDATPIFTINSGAIVEMSHLYIRGAIRPQGSLIADFGGAISNKGKLSIFDSHFYGNAAFLSGGAIVNTGSLYAARTTFESNQAIRSVHNLGSSGGAIYNDDGGIFIAHCDRFEANTAYTAGGAILNGYDDQTSIIHLWRSDFYQNGVTELDRTYEGKFGDILNGQLNWPYGLGGPFALGSNAHLSRIEHATTQENHLQIFDPIPSNQNPLLDSRCAPQSPPRQTQQDTVAYCIVRVDIEMINLYESPVPARTERIRFSDQEEPIVPYETVARQLDRNINANIQLRIELRYSDDTDWDQDDIYNTASIVLVTQINTSPSNATQFVASEWVNLPTEAYWMNTYGTDSIVEPVTDGKDCSKLGTVNRQNLPFISGQEELSDRHRTIEELRQYRVEIAEEGRQWRDEELSNLLEAVSLVGTAFDNASTQIEDDPYRAFYTIMNRDRLTIPNASYVLLIRRPSGTDPVDNGRTTTYDGICFTRHGNDNPSFAKPRNITCYGDIIDGVYWKTMGLVQPEAIVHELGHLFDNRVTAITNSISAAMGKDAGDGSIPPYLDCNGQFLFGWTTDSNNLSTDKRGWDRGWAGWGSRGYDASITLAGGYVISRFQLAGVLNPNYQHYFGVDQTTRTFEVGEAAADMFLNWVYRRQNVIGNITDPCSGPSGNGWDGFLNTDWDPFTNPTCQTGCLQNQAPMGFSGNMRFDWMDRQITNVAFHINWSEE